MTPADQVRALVDLNPEWEGYFITDSGAVFSTRSGSLKTLKPYISKGYERVSLPRGKRHYPYSVARLVCMSFNGPCPDGANLVRHLDGVRRNNKPANLAWGTPRDNALDAVRHGTQSGARNAAKSIHKRTGELSHFAKLTWDVVRDVRNMRSTGKSAKEISKIFGLDPPYIRRICRGDVWREDRAVLTPGGNGNAKINQAMADEIRACRLQQRETAALFGVSQATVCAIKTGKAWRPLPAPPSESPEQ